MKAWWLAAGILGWVAACTGDSPDPVDNGGSSGDSPDATTGSSGVPGTTSSGGSGGTSSGGSSGTSSSSGGSSGDPDASTNDGGDAGQQGLLSIAGLSVWLEGEGLTPGALATWTDRSGKGNNAVASEASERPIVTNTADGINGFPAVQFDGDTFLEIADDLDVQLGNAGYLLAFVERHAAFAEQALPETLFDKFSKAAPFDGLMVRLGYGETAGNLPYVFTQTQNGKSVQTADTAPGVVPGSHLVMVRLAGGSLSITIDQQAPASTAVGAVTGSFAQVGSPLVIGKTSGFGPGFTGSMAAIVLVRAPSDADVNQVSTYLRQRYGL